MKLLEDMPSAVTHRPPPRHTRLTLGAASVLLVAASVVGVVVVSGNGGDTSTNRASWTTSASVACERVATQHPVLTQGATARLDPGNVAAIRAGTEALASAVRDLDRPDDDPAVADVVTAGNRSQQAWGALAAGDVTSAQLTEASELTTSFVTGLVDLGADCAAFN